MRPSSTRAPAGRLAESAVLLSAPARAVADDAARAETDRGEHPAPPRPADRRRTVHAAARSSCGAGLTGETIRFPQVLPVEPAKADVRLRRHRRPAHPLHAARHRHRPGRGGRRLGDRARTRLLGRLGRSRRAAVVPVRGVRPRRAVDEGVRRLAGRDGPARPRRPRRARLLRTARARPLRPRRRDGARDPLADLPPRRRRRQPVGAARRGAGRAPRPHEAAGAARRGRR